MPQRIIRVRCPLPHHSVSGMMKGGRPKAVPTENPFENIDEWLEREREIWDDFGKRKRIQKETSPNSSSTSSESHPNVASYPITGINDGLERYLRLLKDDDSPAHQHVNNTLAAGIRSFHVCETLQPSVMSSNRSIEPHWDTSNTLPPVGITNPMHDTTLQTPPFENMVAVPQEREDNDFPSARAASQQSHGGILPFPHETLQPSVIQSAVPHGDTSETLPSIVINPVHGTHPPTLQTPPPENMVAVPQEREDNDFQSARAASQQSCEGVLLSPHETHFDNILLFAGLSLAAYAGSLVRVGFSHYQIWDVETNYGGCNYCVILGSAMLGCLFAHKQFILQQPAAPSRFNQVLYTSLCWGLCGSVASFAPQALECNKNFFLQWDYGWGGASGTLHGGRLLEWITCLISGVALPVASLALGRFIGSFSPLRDGAWPGTAAKETERVQGAGAGAVLERDKERYLLLAMLVATVLVVCVPAGAFPSWINLSYTVVTGAGGACLQFWLGGLNGWGRMDVAVGVGTGSGMGTLVSLIGGTWLLALVMLLARAATDITDTGAQALLYGLAHGFCSCLSSSSALAAQLEAASGPRASRYALLVALGAQLGIFMVLDIWTFASVGSCSASLAPPPLNLCTASFDVCATLLEQAGCPEGMRRNVPCGHGAIFISHTDPEYTSYAGTCMCGNFSTSRVGEALVEAQLGALVSEAVALVPVWPREPRRSADPAAAFDFCGSFGAVCEGVLVRVGCPGDQRRVSACRRGGTVRARSQCDCGPSLSLGGRVEAALVTRSLTRGRDLIPYHTFVTSQSWGATGPGTGMGVHPLDMCAAFEGVCGAALDHVLAPEWTREVLGCAVGDQGTGSGSEPSGGLEEWVGVCRAGVLDLSDHVARPLFQAIAAPHVFQAMARGPPHPFHPPVPLPSLASLTLSLSAAPTGSPYPSTQSQQNSALPSPISLPLSTWPLALSSSTPTVSSPSTFPSQHSLSLQPIPAAEPSLPPSPFSSSLVPLPLPVTTPTPASPALSQLSPTPTSTQFPSPTPLPSTLSPTEGNSPVASIDPSPPSIPPSPRPSAPTRPPTRSPTSPTRPPTRSPTSPTRPPTRPPTSPTRPPSRAPTSRPSTRAPTYPTRPPTRRPTCPSRTPTRSPSSRSPTGPSKMPAPTASKAPVLTAPLGTLPSPHPTVGPLAITWDVCSSYFNLCTAFLNTIQCPVSLRVVAACGGVELARMMPHGKLSAVLAKCSCGKMRIGDRLVMDAVVDALNEQVIASKYSLMPPARSPFATAISSDPFKQFL